MNYFFLQFSPNYFWSFAILLILMIVSEKSYQNPSDYIHFLLKKLYTFKNNRLFLVKKWEIQVIITMIMLTPSETIFNHSFYTGIIYPMIP